MICCAKQATGRVVVEITEHQPVDSYEDLTRFVPGFGGTGSASRSMTPAPATPACTTS